MRMNRKKQIVSTAGYSLSGGSFNLISKPTQRSPKEAAEEAASKIISKVRKARADNK